jgi:transmembrane E3 ubiquitin-protein ligase
MDTPPPPPADETGNDRPPTQRTSIPSLLFLSFILFMLTHHNGDELLARHMYQDALAGLTSQLGNYTTWLNGSPSNFSLVCDSLVVRPMLLVSERRIA